MKPRFLSYDRAEALGTLDMNADEISMFTPVYDEEENDEDDAIRE